MKQNRPRGPRGWLNRQLHKRQREGDQGYEMVAEDYESWVREVYADEETLHAEDAAAEEAEDAA